MGAAVVLTMGGNLLLFIVLQTGGLLIVKVFRAFTLKDKNTSLYVKKGRSNSRPRKPREAAKHHGDLQATTLKVTPWKQG